MNEWMNGWKVERHRETERVKWVIATIHLPFDSSRLWRISIINITTLARIHTYKYSKSIQWTFTSKSQSSRCLWFRCLCFVILIRWLHAIQFNRVYSRKNTLNAHQLIEFRLQNSHMIWNLIFGQQL